MNKIAEKLLSIVSDFSGSFKGAYNIRQDGGCAGRQSTDHIKIEPKADGSGLDIRILPGTRDEQVSIPACITHGGVDDLVYNDFYVGRDADVTIVAGCGVHTENGEPARHSGIHRFFLEENAHVLYLEKHVGTGGLGQRSIDPVTEVYLGAGSVLEMDTAQLGGVDKTLRTTRGRLEKEAKLLIHERLLTEEAQEAATEFEVELAGEDSGVDLISRAVARGQSRQHYHSRIVGRTRCTGHSECDAIIADGAQVSAAPELLAAHQDAQLIHEAAIGKIAGEQIVKLRTLGLTEKQAEERIIAGFLK